MKENFNFVFNLDKPLKEGAIRDSNMTSDNTNGLHTGGVLRIGNTYVKVLSDIFINLGSPNYKLNSEDELIDKLSGTIEHEHIHREIFRLKDINRFDDKDDLMQEERIVGIMLND